MNSYW